MKNEYKITKAMMKSWAKEFRLWDTKTIIISAIWGLLGVWIVYHIVSFLYWGVNWRFVCYFILLLIIVVYRLFFFRTITYLRNYKTLTKAFEVSEWIRTIEFLEDEILLTDHTSTMKFKYSQITKIKEKSNAVLLCLNIKKGLILYKESFVDGSWEECKELLALKMSK